MQHTQSQLALSSSRERELLSPFILALLLVVGLAVFVSYYWVVSYKSWNLFDGYGFPFPIYDHLAQSLLQGDVAVPPNVESFYFQGKYFVYFGPFPAFIRMFCNGLNPGWFGKAQRLYCLMGAFSCWMAALWIFALALKSNAKLSFQAKRRLLAFLAIAVAWGSPFFFLIVWPSIYHEVLMWALASTLGGLGCYWRSSQEPRLRWMLGLSCAAAVAFLTRLTAGSCLALFVVLISIQALTQRRYAAVLLGSLPVVVAVGMHLWYNHARFGSPFTFIDIRYYLDFLVRPGYQEFFEIYGTQNWHRMPDTLRSYFGFRAEWLHASWPWVRPSVALYHNPQMFIPHREYCISLSVTSSWLILGGICGLWSCVRPSLRWKDWMALLAFAPAWGTIFTFYFVTYRYTADLLPLLFFLTCKALSRVPATPRRKGQSLLYWAPLAIVITWSVLATVSSTLFMLDMWMGSDR
jgi:hypothetical protein